MLGVTWVSCMQGLVPSWVRWVQGYCLKACKPVDVSCLAIQVPSWGCCVLWVRHVVHSCPTLSTPGVLGTLSTLGVLGWVE